ncbi:MAG: endonuclease III [Acidobacteriota bacterium]
MTLRQERADEILRILRRAYSRAKCSLNFENPYQLLIATMLSAQSTDARVNTVTPALFRKYPDVGAMARAKQPALEREIHSTGFFRNKAKAIIAVSEVIIGRHEGEVPQSMEELVALPGVGRKTSNVVLGNAFGKAAGIVVDTHVARVTGRLGLTEQSDPEKIEQDLMALIPRKEWTRFAHRVILHGRNVCQARKPLCSECVLNEYCPSAEEPLE